MSRSCIDCRAPISLANGVLNRRSLDGFGPHCRRCHAANQRARYWADPERHRARVRDYYAARREVILDRARARRAAQTSA